MATIDDVDLELRLFERQFEREEKAEAAFREKMLEAAEAIPRIESKFGELHKKLVPAAETATHKAKEKAVAVTNLWDSILRVFTFAFFGSFVPFVTGVGSGINNMDAVQAGAWAAVIAGLAVVLKLVQASVTKDESPFLDKGIFDGKKKVD